MNMRPTMKSCCLDLSTALVSFLCLCLEIKPEPWWHGQWAAMLVQNQIYHKMCYLGRRVTLPGSGSPPPRTRAHHKDHTDTAGKHSAWTQIQDVLKHLRQLPHVTVPQSPPWRSLTNNDKPILNYESRGLLWFRGMGVSISSLVIGPGVVGSCTRHSEMNSAHSWVNRKGNYSGTWLIRAIHSFFNFTKSKNRDYGLFY